MTKTDIQKRPIDILKKELERSSMQTWLQKQIAHTMDRSAPQLINIVLHAAAQSPKLAECTPTSILSGLVVAAQIGLVPNTALGHAWLIPFDNKRNINGKWIKVAEATLIIGYQGMVKLVAEASGVALKAAPVYSGEPFEYNRATSPPVTLHKHAPQGKRGELVYAYCLAYFERGIVTGEVYDREFILARKARSRSAGSDRSPWVTDPAAMWMKTAIRDFSKQVPKGNDPRLERAIEVDNLDDAVLGQGTVVDMVELPKEAEEGLQEGDASAIDQAARQELGPGADQEFQEWAALIREATTPQELSAVVHKIGKACLQQDLQGRLRRVAENQILFLRPCLPDGTPCPWPTEDK